MSAKEDKISLPSGLKYEEYWSSTNFQQWSLETFDMFWIQKDPSLHQKKEQAHSSLDDELIILADASDKRVAEKAQSLKKLLKNYKTSETSDIIDIIWDSSEEIAKSQVRLTLNELLTKMNLKTSYVAEIRSSKRPSKSMQDNNATASDSNKKIKTTNTDKIESDYNDLEEEMQLIDRMQSEELASVEKPNVTRRLDGTKEDNTEENFLNSVIHASNTFGQVQFPIYYSKLKYLWNNQDAVAYHVIDLGNKEILTQVQELLDEEELKLLYSRLILDDENMHIDEKTRKYLELFDQIIEEDEEDENLEDDEIVVEVAGNELVDKNSEKTKNIKGESEKFDELIDEMEGKVRQLDGLPEKYHYLSNTFPISAQHYDQSKMPDMFIIKSVSSHLDTIVKMNGAMINTPERTWTAHVLAYLFFVTFCFIDSLSYFSCERNIATKIDDPENDFKSDGVLKLFERPIQIPLFLLEVSEGPKNPDPDKINEDRQKLMKEGVFAINKFMTRTKLPTWEVCSKSKVFLAQGFSDNVEIGQMIFVGPGLYLLAPFTIPALTIPTSTDNLEHVPRLIRALLCLRYNVLKEVEIFKKLAREGQRNIAKPLVKYTTDVTPGQHKTVTFAEFLPKLSKEGKKRRRGKG